MSGLWIFVLMQLVNSCFSSFIPGDYLRQNFPKSVIEEAFMEQTEIYSKYGYPTEIHYTTTSDNYILRMVRMPRSQGRPVLLMHGLFDSSNTWTLMGPGSALGYYLYDLGYDVWMGNVRGSRYSRNHTTLNPDSQSAFWKFSWHEIGMYDLPAMIDHILRMTNHSKLIYYGHSQGTTSFFVMTSMRPQYNNKVAVMLAIAPVAFCKTLAFPFKSLHTMVLDFETDQEIFPHSHMYFHICFTSEITLNMCIQFFWQLMGNDSENFNNTMWPAIIGQVPCGASFKQLSHYTQLYTSNRFCQYNYGVKENAKRYGQKLPPDYPLHNITVPIGLFYMHNDNLASVKDVGRMRAILPNIVDDYLFPEPTWNHMSPLWGIDVREKAHKHMIEIMKQYETD